MATKWFFLWIYTWQTRIDYRGHGPNRFWQMGVCVLVKRWLRSHICDRKSGLLSQTSVSVLGFTATRSSCSGCFHTFLSGLKWTVPGKHGKARINQVKQVRSESGLTKCPLLIKFNGIYLNKNWPAMSPVCSHVVTKACCLMWWLKSRQ